MLTLNDYDFDLPESLIALRPVKPRPSSRMLVSDSKILDARVADLRAFLRPGDLLVFNNTKVIPARLRGERRRETVSGTGIANIEATLIERLGPSRWVALAKPTKRLSLGDTVSFSDRFHATVVSKSGGEVTFEFNLSGEDLDHEIQLTGEMPLPPYIAGKRAADAADIEDYQTVFARHYGAVAAPTASLHFDQELLDELAANNIGSTEVTLHVGAGTFLPVKVDNLDEHKMHAEWGEVNEVAAAKINETIANGGRIIPVGTTALRLIETAADRSKHICPWIGDTDIFIRPGYQFKVTDGLMTNFHLPKSTLLMLVSALVGFDTMQEIYRHAIDHQYRFFSYGDSSLLFRNPS